MSSPNPPIRQLSTESGRCKIILIHAVLSVNLIWCLDRENFQLLIISQNIVCTSLKTKWLWGNTRHASRIYRLMCYTTLNKCKNSGSIKIKDLVCAVLCDSMICQHITCKKGGFLVLVRYRTEWYCNENLYAAIFISNHDIKDIPNWNLKLMVVLLEHNYLG